MNRLLRVALAAIAGLLLYASAASAAGMGVTPGKLAFTVRPGGTGVRTLHIINQDAGESAFQVYAEGENADWFTVTPGEFTLAGQERRSLEIAVAPPLTAGPRQYELSICVISVPPGADLRVGAGIKVTVHLGVTSLPVMALRWWIVSAVILVIVVAGVIIWRLRKRRYAL